MRPQYRRESVYVRDRNCQFWMVQHAQRIQAGDRIAEFDEDAAIPVGGEREAAIRHRKAGRASRLDERIRPCHFDPRDVSERCRNSPWAEVSLESLLAYLNPCRRGRHAKEQG